jgi:SAM-dependent MidA family methyltransferase
VTFEAGLRRSSSDDRPLPPSDPVLVERLRAEIEATGPITFARFMEVALTDPERGYYATTTDRPSRTGDFLTAPELHPIFGATLARALAEQWRALDRPDPFVVREYGAGSGTLAEAIVRGLAADGSDLLEALVYDPVELDPNRVAAIRGRLVESSFARAVERAVEPPSSGTILANEFLDALPIHRVEWRDGRLKELRVDWSPAGGAGRFVEVSGEPSTPDLAARLAKEGAVLVEGQHAEICLAIDDWAAGLTGAIDRGFVVVIDYGHPASDLYAPSRAGGTLRAYSGQRVHDDPFVAIGRQDLTAHVDFTAVGAALETAGWRALGLTSQAEFLTGSGLGDLLRTRQADPATGAEEYVALRASVMRLLDPAHLGGFGVVVAGRIVPGDVALSGLAYRVRRQTD